MTSSPSTINCLSSLLQADSNVLLKNTRSLLLSILLPLGLLIIESNRAQSKLGDASFIVALCITIGLMSTSILGYAISVAKDREIGIFQRLRVTPTPTWTILISRLLVRVLANLVIAIVVLVVGSSLYDLSLSVGEYALVLLAAIIGGAVYLSIGQALVGLLKSSETINAAGRMVYIALILLGLLGLSGAFGATIQTISKWTPVGTSIIVFQSALHQAAWSNQTSLALLTSFGYIVVFGFMGIKWFQWDAR